MIAFQNVGCAKFFPFRPLASAHNHAGKILRTIKAMKKMLTTFAVL